MGMGGLAGCREQVCVLEGGERDDGQEIQRQNNAGSAAQNA